MRPTAAPPISVRLHQEDLDQLDALVRQQLRQNPGDIASRADVIRALIRKARPSELVGSTEEWETPASLFAKLDREFHFTLDVAASPENAKCPEFFTKEDDGLSKRWHGTAWCNPPYGKDAGKWVRKAHRESRHGVTVVCLVPARTETTWFQRIALKHGEVRFLNGRVHFKHESGRSGRPRFASAIVIFRPQETTND